MKFICQFCQKEYESDGERKPRFFRKTGEVYQYYDSKLFCSKECCIKERAQRAGRTNAERYKLHPELHEKASEARKETLRKDPQLAKRAGESHRRTNELHPEILRETGKKISKALKETYSRRPELGQQQSERKKKLYKEHPEILLKVSESLKARFKNNSEIMKKAGELRRRYYQAHPEAVERAHDKAIKTLASHPEILENSSDSRYRTAKKNGFISKPEQEMIKLLRDKYGEDDVVEQYRDDRYSKPNTRYRYACDCYIKSLDLFIEFNGSRFHPTENDRQNLLKEIATFKQKYPNRSIEECQANTLLNTIENDRIKQQVAKDNNLNYLIVTEGFKELYDNKIL